MISIDDWQQRLAQAAVPQNWILTPHEAIEAQLALAERLVREDTGEPVHTIAGIDVGIRNKETMHAAVVVFSYPELVQLQVATAERPLSYPYVPGLLTYREAPAVLAALSELETAPDVLMFDGQGIAHPRRMGLAAHLGVLLDVRSIGCAKSRLTGTYEEPVEGKGAYTLLYDGDEVIGAVLRTRTRVRPVYVSIGNKMLLPASIDLVLGSCTRYRLPEPTRWAHHFASAKTG